jgi:hypothetical protein
VPLVSTWSWDYANICAEQHKAGQEAEVGSDWEEGGSGLASDSEGEEWVVYLMPRKRRMWVERSNACKLPERCAQ